MNSNNRLFSLPDEEIIERELPDEYQVVFQTQTTFLRRATLMFIVGAPLLIFFVLFTDALGDLFSEKRHPFWLENFGGLSVFLVFAAMVAYFFRDEFLRYEVLAVGQGSIAVLRKYDLFQRVKWGTFKWSKLKLVDRGDGLACLHHPSVGKFANNTPKNDLSAIIEAIHLAMNKEE